MPFGPMRLGAGNWPMDTQPSMVDSPTSSVVANVSRLTYRGSAFMAASERNAVVHVFRRIGGRRRVELILSGHQPAFRRRLDEFDADGINALTLEVHPGRKDHD